MARETILSSSGGNFSLQGRSWNGIVIDQLEADSRGAIALKRPVTGEHVVQNHSQRKQVGAGIHSFFSQLLGGHKGRASQDLAGKGQVGVVQFSNAEIGDLGMAIGRDQNVCRLDIAMHDSLGMGIVQGLCQFLHQAQRSAHGQRAILTADQLL